MKTEALGAARAPAESTVPSLTLPLIRPDWNWDQYARAGEQAGRQVGNKSELDCRLLDSLEPGLGSQAEQYWHQCRKFWDSVAAGEGGVGLLVQRTLVSYQQEDGSQGRSDLGDVLGSLLRSELASVVDKATSSSPDWGLVDSLAGAKASRTTEGNRTDLTIPVSGRQHWDDLLGGAHSRGELTRVFSLTLNHAPWRDRRVRRLVSVKVSAVELWPVPDSI